MKKETIFAILLGVGLGLTVAVFMVMQTRGEDKTKVIPIAPGSQVTPVVTKKDVNTTSFEISAPEDGSTTDQTKIAIKGKAPKNSLIIVQSAVNTVTVKTDKEDFSVDFPLVLGENNLNVSLYAENSNGAADERQLVVYSITE